MVGTNTGVTLMQKFLVVGIDDPYLIFDCCSFLKAKKKFNFYRYLDVAEYFGEAIILETIEGKATATLTDMIIFGVKGELWPLTKEDFQKRYCCYNGNRQCVSDGRINKTGVLIKSNAREYLITEVELRNFKVCYPSDLTVVDVLQLPEAIRLETAWGVYQAKQGDYLLINSSTDYYICDQEIFKLTYELINT